MQTSNYNGGEQGVIALLCPLTANMLEHVMADSIIAPEGAKAIYLNKGFHTIVDEADYEWLNQWNWHVTDKGYAAHTKAGRGTLMHRLIMNVPKGKITDHINLDRLDNRRANLRICDHHENCWNRKLSDNCASKFKGVNWHKKSGKWQARIKFNRDIIHLGLYTNEIDAAHAYNEAAKDYFGQFCHLNPIPSDWVVTTKNIPKEFGNICMGKRDKNASSQYKGVSKVGNKWVARIKTNGKLRYLGAYATEDEAALIYNQEAKKAWGDMAYVNPMRNVIEGGAS